MTLLGKLLRRARAGGEPAPRVPEGERVYAIGDIHGRLDLFDGLLDRIAADNAARGSANVTLILLGDLIDRGPDSRGVVERSMQLRGEWPCVRWLIGNHEEAFLAALDGEERMVKYAIGIGADATIHSYGLSGDAYDRATFAEIAAALPGMVPAAHASFLAAGEDMIIIGEYAFVHAGVRPGVPLERQTQKDMRWIRNSFLEAGEDFGKIIVHGHSISADVQRRRNRIGIDTGAYDSGVLTAIGLEGAAQWFLDTRVAVADRAA